MDEDDVQRPLHYAALRRSPTTKPGAKQLFAKAACGVDDPAPKAVPLNDRRADIFGNTEFLHGLGECDVARRRNIGGYLIVEQRQNREFHNYGEFNWSRLASDANGDTVPRTQTIYTYQLTDPLGSVAVQVRMIDNNTYTANATQSERNPRYLNFDAHGKQRAGNGRTAVDNNGDSDTNDPGEEALTAWQPLSYYSEQRTRPEGTWQGYAGHQNYNSVGIVHMKGRIYDPTLGRFLQPDPIVEDDLNPQTWNRYTYVRNNPMTFTDPTGYATQCGERCKARNDREKAANEKFGSFWGMFGGLGTAGHRGSSSGISSFGTITPRGSSSAASSSSGVSVGDIVAQSEARKKESGETNVAFASSVEDWLSSRSVSSVDAIYMEEIPDSEKQQYLDASLTELEAKVKSTKAFSSPAVRAKYLKNISRMKAANELVTGRGYGGLEAEVTSELVLKVYPYAFRKGERPKPEIPLLCVNDPTIVVVRQQLLEIMAHELRHYGVYNLALKAATPNSARAKVDEEFYRTAPWEVDARDFGRKLIDNVPNSIEVH